MSNGKYYLVIKWVCNTNCSFCNFYEFKENVNNDEHYIELIKEIDKCVNDWVDSIVIWFHWFEPTEYIYFIDILNYIKSKWIRIWLSTNWVKLADKEYVKSLINLIDSVNITLYSSNDSEHNILTQNNE